MADLGLDASQETRITVMQMQIERLEEKQLTSMQDNNLYGNAYERSGAGWRISGTPSSKKKSGSKKRHTKEGISLLDFMNKVPLQ